MPALRFRDESAHGSRRNAAVDQQSLAGHVAARLGSEENNSRFQVLGLAWPLHGNPIREIFDPFAVLVENLVLVGPKPSRRQTVDGHAIGTPVVGEAHGELADAAPAGAVWSEASIARDAGDGSNVDDATVTALHHPARDSLGDEKAATQVGVENQVPVIPGHVERRLAHVASGVIYEDVDVAKFFLSRGGHFLNAVVVAYIQCEGKRSAAESLDFFLEVGERVRMAAGEHKVGPGVGQSSSERLAEAATGTGHDGHASGEVEQLVAHGCIPGTSTTFIKFGS